MLKRNIALLIAAGLLSAQAGLAVAEGAGAWNFLPTQAKYLAEQEAANPNPTGAKDRIFSTITSSLNYHGGASLAAWARAGGIPAQAKYIAEREARIRAEGPLRVSLFDPCQMHSHGDVGFHDLVYSSN